MTRAEPSSPSLARNDQVDTDQVHGESREGSARNFPCEGCGADLTFHIGIQSLTCPYCGYVKALREVSGEVAEQDYESMARRMVALRRKRESEASAETSCSEVTCGSCGSTVRFVGALISRECAYCGAPLQLEGVQEARDHIPVDGVLPFLVERKQARGHLNAWIQSRWFAPNDFKKRGVDGRFNGVYLPYWTFDALTFNRYAGQRGEYYYVTVGTGKNRRTVRKTRWYPAAGEFQRFFDDVLVVAGEGLPSRRLRALEPWPLAKCIPYNDEVLAGLLARTYEVALDRGFLVAKGRMDIAIEAEVCRRIGGDTQRVHSIESAYDAITYKHLLLPVWMMAYRYGQKSYQVVVNAATGEVQGDRPYSWTKIALAVLAGAVVVAGIALLLNQP
ncbi:MAG: hypothetical protein ACE5E5_13740 [Phycisphaerae bacterium]